MSERITITVIGTGAGGGPQEWKVTHDSDMTLMSTLQKERLITDAFCGGRGVCKRCRVQFLETAPLPTVIERNTFHPDELRRGYRLACMAKPRKHCTVRLDFVEACQMEIVTEASVPSESGSLMSENSSPMPEISKPMSENSSPMPEISKPMSENSGPMPETSKPMSENSGPMPETSKPMSENSSPMPETSNPISESGSPVSEKNDPLRQGNYIAAVDLGTTTIAMQLRKLDTGECMDTYCAMNPQRAYGADVLSRIQAAQAGHSEAMREDVRQVLQAGLRQFCEKLDGEKGKRLCCMSIAGNTVMEHLLMGLPTAGLGKSPFTPVRIGLQRDAYALPGSKSFSLPVYVLPGISAFVGGDIVAGLFHCGLLQTAAFPHPADETVLFIDLGTNGELAIVDKKRMIVTATAAGPAFEGGADVPGSDMVAVTAFLLEQGIMDETGLLQEPYFSDGITLRVTDSGMSFQELPGAAFGGALQEDLGKERHPVSIPAAKDSRIHLTQRDIRELQMAKAAVRAGVEILYEKMDCPDRISVYLAGGFGYYLNVEAAVRIGLIPEYMGKRVKAVGNTALAGAFDMGRWIWNNRPSEQTLEKIPGQTGERRLERELERIPGQTGERRLERELERMLEQIESINLAQQDGFEEKYLGYLNFPV